MAAWAKVEQAIRRVGGHSDVVFDDPVIHRCIGDMGGWIKLCSVLESELAFRAKDFQNLYRGYAMRREIPEYQAVLIGRFNCDNQRRGMPLQPPALIGDKASAAQVMALGANRPPLQIERLAAVLHLPPALQIDAPQADA